MGYCCPFLCNKTIMSNNANALLAWYLSNLVAHPLRTKACTSGLLSGLQELTAQKLSGAKKLDKRIVQMACYGNRRHKKSIRWLYSPSTV